MTMYYYYATKETGEQMSTTGVPIWFPPLKKKKKKYNKICNGTGSSSYVIFVNNLLAVLWMTSGWQGLEPCAGVQVSLHHTNSYVLCHISYCTQVMWMQVSLMTFHYYDCVIQCSSVTLFDQCVSLQLQFVMGDSAQWLAGDNFLRLDAYSVSHP